MKFYFLTAVLISLFFTAACSSFSKQNERATAEGASARAEQEAAIARADQALQAKDFQTAESLYADFQARFPASVFYQRAQMGRAKALEALEKWAEAAELYRNTIEITRVSQPDIAALALYRVSYVYENLEDEARVMASLKDALQMKDYLPPEQSLAEIPARMAASYNRMGRTEEARHYFRLAESGIQQVRSSMESNQSPEWLSRIYFNMGVLSTNQLDWQNIQASLDTLKMVQIFSLRSAESGGPPWSKMASDGLIANYRDLWDAIQKIPLNKAMDMGAAKREQVDRQLDLSGQLLALINELRQYRSPESAGQSPEAKDLFLYLDQLERKAQSFLMSVGDQTPLTPEAEKRGGLKR